MGPQLTESTFLNGHCRSFWVLCTCLFHINSDLCFKDGILGESTGNYEEQNKSLVFRWHVSIFFHGPWSIRTTKTLCKEWFLKVYGKEWFLKVYVLGVTKSHMQKSLSKQVFLKQQGFMRRKWRKQWISSTFLVRLNFKLLI